MHDSDLRRVLARAGSPLRPDAEFEEELLLRIEDALEAERDDIDPRPDSWSNGVPPRALPLNVVTADRVAADRRRRGGSAILIAASLLVVGATVGLALTSARGDLVETPSAGAPPATTVTTPGFGSAAPAPGPTAESPVSTISPRDAALARFAAVCDRWIEDLLAIEELGDPLGGGLVQSREAVGDTIVQLRSIADAYLSAADSAAGFVPDSLIAEIVDISDRVDAERAMTELGRWDGSRYAVPGIVRDLLALNAELSNVGVVGCG